MCSALLTGAICAIIVAAGSPAWAATPDTDKGNVSVTVTDGSTPGPSASPTQPAAGGSGSGGSGSNGGTGSGGFSGGGSSLGGGSSSGSSDSSGGQGAGGGQSPATPGGEVSLSGMLFMGGLETSSALSLNPGEAVVTISFTVRNASQSTIDASVDFWMNSVLGNEIDADHGVPVSGLLPGESRVVTTQLHSAGQWTLINAHATLTPPSTVDGVELEPVTRDAMVFVVPWFLAVLLILVVLAFALGPRLVRSMQQAEPAVTSA